MGGGLLHIARNPRPSCLPVFLRPNFDTKPTGVAFDNATEIEGPLRPRSNERRGGALQSLIRIVQSFCKSSPTEDDFQLAVNAEGPAGCKS